MSKYRLLDANEMARGGDDALKIGGFGWEPVTAGDLYEGRLPGWVPVRRQDDGNGQWYLLEEGCTTEQGDHVWVNAHGWKSVIAGQEIHAVAARRRRVKEPTLWVVVADGRISTNHWEESAAVNEARCIKQNAPCQVVVVAHITHELSIETIQTGVVKEVGH
jgi:hypothetical protein